MQNVEYERIRIDSKKKEIKQQTEIEIANIAINKGVEIEAIKTEGNTKIANIERIVEEVTSKDTTEETIGESEVSNYIFHEKAKARSKRINILLDALDSESDEGVKMKILEVIQDIVERHPKDCTET